MVGANGSALPNYVHEEHQRLNDHHSLKIDREFGHYQTLNDHHSLKQERENEHHQTLNDHHLPRSDRENEQLHQSQKAITSLPRRVRSVLPARGPKPLLPRSLKEALQLASLLSKSKLVPKGFENQEACLVGILYGMEVGLSPIAALQRMAIIEGRPTIWGDAALALVEASGLLIKIEERMETLEVQTDHQSSDRQHNGQPSRTGHQRPEQSEERQNNRTRTAICQVLRSGRFEPITRSFSVEDAKRAGLWQKPGPWTDYPERMLMMRARAFALRDAFPDVLMGLYLREEFESATSYSSNNDRNDIQSDWDTHVPNQAKQINPTRSYPTREDDQRGNPTIRPSTIRRAPPPPPVEIEVEVEDPSRPENQPTGPIEGLENNIDLHLLSECDDAALYQSASDTLELFDSALACAKDTETLEEIREEFNERIDRLDSESLQEAGGIFLKHEKRIRASEAVFKTSVESPDNSVAKDPSTVCSDVDKIEAGLGEVDYETEECESGLIENATGRIGKQLINPQRRRRFFIRPRKGLSLAELNARRKVDLLKYMPRSFPKKEGSNED